ncbi:MULTISPECIES: DUF751 family protein [Moorena]|uniref:DUF751 family protein n=1 Tax=Moorena producens (strain JHB) TaxID=1454205 RepID=A0A1D9G781_MOOP1|nr:MULTISPECIES: DUF751 family protein [Moorena]NES85335.1 DUF751 family protein [Moorena sp. SIO2B7]AOY83502.1 DUF751 family protein [Moorena producens JHB]NEP30423.1 DUF751 family protein [Moorena sp. SIO3B2]NEQ09774.1 DUF751 family protein [Moorena sp. SIO4E2]NER88326.1 DUF751 family protein [Moorena sp. SIO3A2]
MEDFFKNVSRYPRYLISITLGIFYSLFLLVKPLLNRPLTAIALIGIVVGVSLFLVFTLRGMLGFSPV